AIDVRLSRQIQHRLQVDRGLGTWTALANKARPHCIVERRSPVLRHISHGSPPERQCLRSFRNGSLSGLPGPKCFRMTSGSLALTFSMRTPAFAASADTNN